jgi:hypothetical protein
MKGDSSSTTKSCEKTDTDVRNVAREDVDHGRSSANFQVSADRTMLGGSPFGSPPPQGSDDAGTPFSVVVIPGDDKLAVGSEMK